MSQTGQQIITIFILQNISRSSCNQAMKFSQLIEYNKYFFFKNHAENEERKLVADSFVL